MTQPAVALLHGFLGSGQDFAPLAAALAPRWRAVALDLPGHGSAPPPPADFAAAAAQVLAQLRASDLLPCHLVGYSMGGRIALQLALGDPKTARSVVAVGSHVGYPDTDARAQRLAADRALAQRLRQRGVAAFAAEWYQQDLFANLRQSPGFADLLARRQNGDPAGMAAALEAFSTGAQPWLEPALCTTAIPMLLLAGARDAKYAALGRRLAEANPALAAATVADAGHAVPFERPHAFAQVLTAFLARHE